MIGLRQPTPWASCRSALWIQRAALIAASRKSAFAPDTVFDGVSANDAGMFHAASTGAAAAVTETLELMVAVRPTFHPPALFGPRDRRRRSAPPTTLGSIDMVIRHHRSLAGRADIVQKSPPLFLERPGAVPDAQIPQLDLRRLGASPAERTEFLAELRDAAHRAGFFYLTGHGIEAALLSELIDVSHRFFGLAEHDKLAVEMVNSPHFRGYNRVAWERTRGLQDWREQIDIGAEQSAAALSPDSPAWLRLRGPNQWPVALPELRPIVLRWQTAAAGALTRLLRAFSLALGQDAEVLTPLVVGDPHLLVKLIRYPGREVADSDQGVGAHKDSGLLTLLLQDEQGGLQVEVDGAWIDVPPRPDTLVVNIGELLELASDGYLRATLDRVMTPPAGRERISVAFFLGAPLDLTVPLLDLPPQLAAQAHGPEQDPNNPLFRQVGENYLKGRLRSHPDVARRHYADLIGRDTGEMGAKTTGRDCRPASRPATARSSP
jgi:isopenicillin N synthase-like dioxygenase